MKKLYIKADFGDADYGHYLAIITDETFERFLPVFKAINDFEPYIRRHRHGGIDYSNWVSRREDLGDMSLKEKYPGIGKELLDEFAETLVNPIPIPEEGCLPDFGPHTIVSIVDIVTDKVYVNTDGLYFRHNSKVKEYLAEETRIYSYKRESDGKPLHSIPFSEMTKEENRMIEELYNLWRKYV